MQINFRNTENSPSNTSEKTEFLQLSKEGINSKTSQNPATADSKKQKKKYLYLSLIVILIFIVLASGFAFGKIYFDSKNNTNQTAEQFNNNSTNIQNTPTPTPEPIFYPNPINGVMLSEETYNSLKTKPFLAVMIQNNTASRPEYGLNEADIVYESLVESNITRFMSVFWSKDSERVQSLRSARKYFVDILGDYNSPAYMHIGYAYCVPSEECDARNDALVAMNKYGIRRLSDSRNTITNELSFSRDKDCEKIRATEHCAYTNTQRLWTIADQKGWKNDLSNYVSWKFTDQPMPKEAKPLTNFSTFFKSSGNYHDNNYTVIWKYDEASNKYLRYNSNNTPYLDGFGKQVTTDTVIYQKVVSTPSLDHKGHQYQETIGSGTGYVMQQGKVFPINWSKKNFTEKTKFTDATTGSDFEFQRGKMWVMVVPKYYDYVDNTPASTPTVTTTLKPSWYYPIDL